MRINLKPLFQICPPGWAAASGCVASDLVRIFEMKSTEEPVPEVESAFSRLHVQLRKSERALEVRTSELQAAERHIAQLEGCDAVAISSFILHLRSCIITKPRLFASR